MGTNLVIRKNGKYITELGRQHRFTKPGSDELDIRDDFEDELETLQEDVLGKIFKIQAFLTGKKEVVEQFNIDYPQEEFTKGETYDIMMEQLYDSIEYLTDTAWENSQKSLVGYMLMDEDLEYTFE